MRWLLADEVGPGQDHRSGADHEPPAAHAADRALPGRRARGADGAVAGRVVAQISPGVHAARCAAPGRRRARLRRRLQPVRRPSPRGHRARDAGRAAGADRRRRWRPASTCSSSTRRSGCGAGPGIPASRSIARLRRSPRSAGTCCCSARRRSKTTRTGSSGCCSCCGRTSFPRALDVEARLASGVPLPPCTSSTRRVDIGGLPPRVPIAIDLPPDGGVHALGAGSQVATGSRRATRSRGRAAGAGSHPAGAGIRRGAEGGARAGRDRAAAAGGRDGSHRSAPAVAADAGDALAAGEREDAGVRRPIARRSRCCATRSARARSSPAACSTKSSRRRGATPRWRGSGPTMGRASSCRPRRAARGATSSSAIGSCSTTCRGSLRRWSSASGDSTASAAEYRSTIVYFRPAAGIGADVVRLFERLGLFREPMAGVEPQLAHVERALEEIALDPEAALSDAQIDALIADAQAARTRIHEAAYQQLHRDPYRAELGPSILARVPADLDALMEQVVVNAASRLGFRVEQVRGRRAYAIEFGNEALVDSLPGVPGGVVVRRHIRSRVRGRGRDHRLLRLGTPARRRAAGALRGGSEGPRRAARAPHSRPARHRAGRHLQGRAAVRGRGLRRGRARAAGLGRRVPPPAAGWAEDEDGRCRRARLARARDASRPAAREPAPACDRGGGGPST